MASTPGRLPAAGLVGGAALTVFIALAPLLLPRLSLPYRSTSGIVSWVASVQYPIHEQSLYFTLALIALPVMILLFGGIWVGLATVAGGAPASALCWSALAFLPPLALWRKIPILDAAAWQSMVWVWWLTAALMVLIPLVIRVINRVWPAVPVAGLAAVAAPVVGVPPPPTATVALRASPRWRGLRLAYGFLVWFILPCVIYLVMHAARRELYTDTFHEGERLAPANQMLHGGVPYRDIYCQHGLLRNAIVPWLAVKTFGVSRDSVIHGEHLIIPWFFVACYFLGLSLFRLGAPMALALVVLTAGLWLENVNLYDGMAGRQLFAVLAVALVAGTVRGPRGLALLDPRQTPVAASGGFSAMLAVGLAGGKPLAAAGLCAALAFWYSVDMGLYAGAALGVLLILAGVLQSGIPGWRRPLPLACFTIGAVGGFWLFGAGLVWQGAFTAFLDNVILQTRYQSEMWGLPFRGFLPGLRLFAAQGWHAGGLEYAAGDAFLQHLPLLFLFVGVAVVTVLLLQRDFWASPARIHFLLILLWVAALQRTPLGRASLLYTFYIYPGFLLLLLFVADQGLAGVGRAIFTRRTPIFRRLGTLAWALAALALCVIPGWRLLTVCDWKKAVAFDWNRWRENPFPLPPGRSQDRLGATIPAAVRAQLEPVIRYIQANTAPGEAVLNVSCGGALLFYADRPSVSRYFNAIYACTSAAQRQLIADLERSRPRLAIFKSADGIENVDGVPIERRLPLVQAYLDAHYTPTEQLNGYQFLRRK
ncbi:MAG: hypothetical protein WCH61_00705 [bacterium]